MTYITQSYDFYDAITKNLNLESAKYKGFSILNVQPIETVRDAFSNETPLQNAAIVETTHGKYYCETWEDPAANVFMRVTNYI